MENIDFVSIVPQTFEERVEMYMKFTKEELARMLAEQAKYTNPAGCSEMISDVSDYGVTTTVSTGDEDWTYIYDNQKYTI